MYRGNRYGISKTRHALKFKNPYRSTGVRQKASRVIVGPIRREGITSLENEERRRAALHLNQLTNAGMVKQMQELGIIPDDLGVDMSDYNTEVTALPHGVTSLHEAEKQADVARQIERYNAGILDAEQIEQKALMKLMKKRKKSDYKKKIIQWLAETDELDSVPAEFEEEVENYYKSLDDDGRKKNKVAEKRRKRKEKEDKEIEKKRQVEGYWHTTSPLTSLTHKTGISHSYAPVSTRMNETEMTIIPNKPEDKPYIEIPSGHGVIDNGWRAPRLHKLVRPLKRFELGEKPDKIIEDQKEALDERRDIFRNLQTEQRGITPPKDMIERAMPKTAEPFISIPHKIYDFNITPHPFVFPHKKYFLQFGI